MQFQSIDPYDGRVHARFDVWDAGRIEQALADAAGMFPLWRDTSLRRRAELLARVGERLLMQRDELAEVMCAEMGKRLVEARAEVEKSALVCAYYAEQAEAFMADEPVHSGAGRSVVVHEPLGPVLAVMPWNFPLWQVFRFAAPALVAGNVGLLKHASNVPQCAVLIEDVIREAGVPAGVFQTLMIRSGQVDAVVRDARVRAVSLTGSEPAGRAVARAAGESLKKAVLELGGSDAFIVLEDADLAWTVERAVQSRFANAGQSCIAAKRFLVVEAVADDFVARLAEAVRALEPGDPRAPQTTLAPLARADLVSEIDAQVRDALAQGARCVTGGTPLPALGPNFYAATVLEGIRPGMRAWEEELFGPVALVTRVADEEEALSIANGSRFGLGGSVWTRDVARGEALARRLTCGAAFVNDLVHSDPRLPFGGCKDSGYGRELSRHGLREFVNVKTLWVR
ncbi:MAG: NAD-dependent succinate-semialdehyde dehydrogenase [Halothiobacillaceae bacterium]|jgi:succinate-semialdehyde dehydrogenase/glutarate-semialdehyde dehydrogenase|nr:NAD-dependent succinate-semialdehyde dehydrogenase [Halothiobacillaceae bacterium]